MSLAEPQALPTTTLDISDDLLLDVEHAVPCQIEMCFSGDENPGHCPNEPAFLVVFKPFCDHHGKLPDGDPLVCPEHAGWLARGDYGCGGCECHVKSVGGWRHLIIDFKEL